MESLRIIIVSILAAVFYGILHDQITARICVEYFTIGHVRLIDSNSPTILGLFWGVVATWWVGLALGIGLVIAARSGRRPKLCVQNLLRPIGTLMVSMFALAVIGGIIGYVTSKLGVFQLVEPLASRVPPEKHIAFLTAGWAHSASYLSAFIGGLFLWRYTWKLRVKMALNTKDGNQADRK